MLYAALNRFVVESLRSYLSVNFFATPSPHSEVHRHASKGRNNIITSIWQNSSEMCMMSKTSHYTQEKRTLIWWKNLIYVIGKTQLRKDKGKATIHISNDHAIVLKMYPDKKAIACENYTPCASVWAYRHGVVWYCPTVLAFERCGRNPINLIRLKRLR